MPSKNGRYNSISFWLITQFIRAIMTKLMNFSVEMPLQKKISQMPL